MSTKTALAILALCLVHAPFVQAEDLNVKVDTEHASHFLKPGSWYNLYFTKENNPLARGGDVTIAAVKVTKIGTDSWVQITFPADQDQRLGLLRARSADKEKSGKATADGTAFMNWQKSVTAWETMWVNLGYVVRITEIE